MPDELLRALLDPPRVRVVATVTTETVQAAVGRHGTVGAATVALGRALTSGLLLATLTKGEERVTLQIAGDGPISLITVDADDAGSVRGYLSPRGVPVPLGAQRRPSIAAAIGRGEVSVLRDLGLRERYRGSAAIVTGEIDEDVEAYLRLSEQLDSALGCEVVVGREGEAHRAGGLLMQAMPGGEPELIRAVQHELRTGRLYAALAGSASPADAEALARAVLGELPLTVLDRRPVRFQCRCSQERALSIVAMLEQPELDDLLAREGAAEITCNFCSARYIIDRATLIEILDQQPQRGGRQRN
jgi:molecular chaperone Hsp33